jgi:ubiquitin carboxyl-terminal hydrolase 9/24
VEKYMQQIIGILVEQQPNKIGGFERKCVQESLSEAIMIISLDLQIQIERGPAAVCKTLDVLSTIFNKKKVYYKVHKGNWTVNHFTGLPETRTKMIDLFRQEQGFQRLYTYMIQRMENGSLDPMCENGTTNGDTPPDMNMEAVEPAPEISKDESTITSSAGKAHSEIKKATVRAGFPTVEQLHHVLVALAESIPNPRNTMAAAKNRNIEAQQQPNSANDKDIEDRAIEIAKATMQYIGNSSEDDLKTIPTEQLTQVQSALQKIFDRLVINRRENTYEYYAFWRSLIWKLITSKSLPLKLFGWQQVDDILMASGFHRPPPRSYLAEGAGCSFANGIYLYSGATTPDGYALGGSDVNYERIIPDDVEDGGGKKLTLFRCTMRSQQKWWFLSEADEEQPGTDRDIDYYQHKSKEHEEIEPPRDGWITCRNAGIDPPPTLLKQGRMVPDGEEFNTLEHQLAKWAIENDIMELVLGDSVHRETVARSTPLIKFLASMCERDEGVTSGGGKVPNQHCLQLSHLLLAWKTCTRKTDAAVSAQIYQLLVSILPSCPACLAIPLLKEIKESLVQPNKDKQDYLVEVADFCTALAVANPVDGTKGGTMILSNEVRAEVLELLWQVLMHPEASSLKSYDILKGYVNCELGVEPEGTKHREKYLESCIAILTLNSKQIAVGSIDETQALKIVKLTHFVLEACNRQQAAELAVNGTGSLPFLLFDELVSFLKRRQNGNTPQASLRKVRSFYHVFGPP